MDELFEVVCVGKTVKFQFISNAVEYLNSLDDGADLWLGDTLLVSRVKNHGTGEFDYQEHQDIGGEK